MTLTVGRNGNEIYIYVSVNYIVGIGTVEAWKEVEMQTFSGSNFQKFEWRVCPALPARMTF